LANRRPGGARGLVVALTLLLVGLLGVGCERGADDSPQPTASIGVGDEATQTTLDALAGALRRRDRAAYEALVDRTDPEAGVALDRFYANLVALRLTRLEFRLRGPPRGPGAGGAPESSADSWTQQVVVVWRLADDRGPAEHLLALTFRPAAGRTRLAGFPVAPPAGGTEAGGQPLWAQQPLAVARADRVTVLATDRAGAGVWLDRGRAAVRAVAGRLPAELAPDWSRSLVVEVPATRQAFERVLGVPPGSYAEMAAVAWPTGPAADASALRVVVNPTATARLDATSVAVLLAHEVVHVATRSPASSAPTWLVEGYADYLAYAAYPSAQPAAARDLLAEVRAPRRLPTDADFAPGSRSLPLHYAAAWSACRFVATETSPAALARLYRLADAGRPVDAAVRTALGTDLGTLTERWRRDLAAQAERAR